MFTDYPAGEIQFYGEDCFREEMKFESLPSTMLPLQMWMPEEEINVSLQNKGAAVSPTTAMAAVVNGSSGFTAPEDQDLTPGLVDRMLGIENKERSIKNGTRKMTFLERLIPKKTSSSLTLPTGWVIEKCVRTRGASAGRVDKYYVDPDTGVKFRSLLAVKRYLLELEEEKVPLKMLGFRKKDKISHQIKMVTVEGNSGARSRTSSFELPDGLIIEKCAHTSGNSAGNADKMLGLHKKDKIPHQREMAIVEGNSETRTRTSSFELPDGWIIEKCVRASGNSAGNVDKYYIEPGTMRRYRSRASVQRRLAELDGTPPSFTESKSDKFIRMSGVGKKGKLVYERKLVIVSGTTTTITSSSKLPEGWVVEERVRSSGRFAGVVDKYYIEPGTMRKFRSFISVQRHLAERDCSSLTPQQSNQDNLLMQSQHLLPWEEKLTDPKEKTSSLDSAKSPMKIKWAFAGPGGDTWNPFVDESMVADSVKQRWNDSFISSFDLI